MPEECCGKNKSDKGFLKGVFYGIIPHSVCIGFILFSIIGSVSIAGIFKKIMMIPYFIQGLIALSIVMATISAVIYLKRNNCLCGSGIKNKWKYLTILYGLTIFTNIFMFSYVLPALANINSNSANVSSENLANLSLAVQIPCSGHAPLIIDELKKDSGVKNVIFQNPDTFNVSYDPNQTSPDKIENLDIFKTYKLKVKI